MSNHYDVIVVGARVAGSSLAYELSQAGYSVLLLDKSEFPSDTLSTHNFFGNSVAMLRKMGVLDSLLETGAPLYRRAVIQFEDAVIDGHFPKVDGETECLCIRRLHLDALLLRHASAQAGVTAVEGFRVTDAIREGSRVTGVEGVRKNGEKASYTARLVVGADGRQSTLRRLVNSERKLCVPTDYASYVGYYADFAQDGEIHVELYKIADTIGIVFPTSDNLYVVGVMFPLDNQQWRARFKDNPEQAMRDLFDQSYSHTSLPERLRKASLAGQVRGLLGYDNDWYQGMGEGWALTGDAISFKDPAVGQGMQNALYAATILTNVLKRHDDWDASWEEMAGEYQHEMESLMMSRFHMACQFTKNVPFSAEQRLVNQAIAETPELTQAFLGIYNHAVEPEQFEQLLMGALRNS